MLYPRSHPHRVAAGVAPGYPSGDLSQRRNMPDDGESELPGFFCYEIPLINSQNEVLCAILRR